MPVCAACAQRNPGGARFCMWCASPLYPDQLAVHGTRKTVTVVFCDVTGSTSLAERLDPESVREVMKRFFRKMQAVLERHGGTVEKFIGDAVMAVFGVPMLHEDDALRAVRAAAGMLDALDALNGELEPRWGVTLRTRTGVNTGVVMVGDSVGGDALAVGDPVNLAARLEQAAQPGEILLGPETFAIVRDHVVADAIEGMELKGKQLPVTAYRLRSVEAGLPRFRPDSMLVDRTGELTELRAAFGRSTEGRGCVLLTVLGAAGIGKSRMASELESCVGGQALVLRGRCLSYGEGITFWAVAELVKRACDISSDDSREEARRKIEAALEGAEDGPLVAERVAALIGFSSATASLQETFWAVRRFLERLGREQPLLVIIDDIQWAETALLDLVEYLAGWCDDTALLLVCLARPDLLDVRPSWGTGTENATSLLLAPLSRQESEQLITGLLGGARLDKRTVARIAESTGGNPLFVEEMIRMLEDDGLLRRADFGWVVSGDLADVSVPASIHALLAARLDRLAPGELDVIRCAAVEGKEFWWGAVTALAPEMVRTQVGSHLQTLVRKGLIRPERSSFVGEDAFRFHNILIQEAVYRGTPKEIRSGLHERFAVWIEGIAEDRVVEYEEVIGYHLEHACRYRRELGPAGGAVAELAIRGARMLAAAGRRAFTRGDVSAAADLLWRAVALFPEDHPERRALLADAGEVLSEAGDLERAEAVLREAVSCAERLGDPGLRANALIVGLLVLESTDPKRRSQALAQVEALLPVLEDLGDDRGLARAYRLLGDIHWVHCHYAAADDAFERALHYARRGRADWEEAWILGQYTGSGMYGPVPAAVIERRCEEVLAQSKGMGIVQARAVRALAGIRAMEGSFDEARELAGRARTILEELGLRLRAAFISQTFGFIETLAGDFAAAESELRAGYAAAIELRERGFQATVSAELAHALIEQGKYDEAEVLTRLSEDIGAEDDLATQVMWRSAAARILAVRKEAAGAEFLARSAVALAENTDDLNMRADTLLDLGEVLRAADLDIEAAKAFAQAFELYKSKGNLVRVEEVRRKLGLAGAPT